MHAPHLMALLAWFVGWLLLFRVPRLPRKRRDGATDPVTIIIPARNEEASLPHLLSDLDRVRPAGSRVLVVDDHSEDATATLAAAYPFVEVLTAPPLEAGWTGKAWACHAGAAAAGPGPGRLVFLDADVRLHGDALDRALDVQREQGGLLSIWPWHAVQRPYEHLSALFNTAAMMASGAGSPIPPRKPRAAFGPVLVTSQEAYDQVGGHTAVRADVIEDFALARTFGQAGLPVRVFGGGRDVTFRMYPDGFRSLFEGWTKNFAGGAVKASPFRVAALVFWVVCSVGLLTWAHGIPETKAVVLYGLFAAQILVFFRQVGSFGVVDAILYPLHVAFFVLVFLGSIYRTFLRRSVSWRGRTVDLGDTPRQGGPA